MTSEDRIAELQREITALKNRADELQDFLDTSDVPLTTVDADGRILWGNQAQLDLVGRDLEGYAGKTISDFYHSVTITDILRKLAAGERVAGVPAIVCCGDGSLRDVLISANGKWEGGRFAYGRLATQDITDRKRAEEQLQQTAEMLQAIVNASPLPIVAINRDGNIFLWNASAERLFGWTAAEVLGLPLPFIPEEKLAEHREMRRSDLKGTGFTSREIWRRRKDGSPLHLLVSTAPTHAPDGDVTGIMSVYVDITDRKRAEQELKRNASRLARSNAELEQYAFAASHDLQEPLRLVTLYSQLLVKHCGRQLDGRGHEYLRVLDESAGRMRDLIDGLLSYSRAVASPADLVDEFETGETVARAVANCKAAIDETGAVVRSGDLPRIRGNRDQIALLFQNLISNAIKYGQPGRTPEIQIHWARVQDHWEFTVRDNGMGFSMEYAERIFGLFRRLHGRTVPGTGIGLALCKRIVEEHGGRIWAESKEGAGSAFHFTLKAG